TIDGTDPYSQDIRDSSKGYTVNFQRYQFTHSARYFIVRFQASNRTNGVERVRARLYSGTSIEYAIDIERFGGWESLVVDLGKPTYERKEIDLRIGFLRNWKVSGRDALVFRISRVYLSDII